MKTAYKLSLLILYLFIFNSCKSDSNDFIDDPIISPEFLAYINASINNELIKTEIPFLGNSNYKASIGYTKQTNNTNSCTKFNYEPRLDPVQNLELPKFSIGFIGFLNETTQSCADELSIFDTLVIQNMFNYAQDANGQGVNVKFFKTSNGDPIYTTYGPQDDKSSFIITKVEVKNCSPKKCVNVFGTFSATLYNVSNSSESIYITSGNFKLKIESFN